MTLLSGIRSLFLRWRGPARIAPPPQPAEWHAPEPPRPAEEDAAAEIEAAQLAEPADEKVAESEPAPAPEGITAEEAEELFTRESDKIAALLGELDSRIGAQAAVTQRLAQKTEQLPHVVAGITEIKAQCSRAIELLSESLTKSRTGEEAVAAAAARITDASAHKAEELEGIRRQLDGNAQAIRRAGQATEAVTENLRGIAEMTTRLQAAIAAVDRAGQEREAAFARLLAVHKRSMTLFAFGCCLAALLAVAVALVAILA